VFPRGKDRVSEIASDEYPFRDPASGNSNSVSDAWNIIAKKTLGIAWKRNYRLWREIGAGAIAEGVGRWVKLLANGNAKSMGTTGTTGKWCGSRNRRPR